MSTQFHAVTPYLYYADADAAIEWLTRVFGFGPAARWTDDTGTLVEADIGVGDHRVAIGARAPGVDEGRGQGMIVHVDDVDGLYDRIRRELGTEGTGVEPPVDQPYGPRTLTVIDPWGYRWYFWFGNTVSPNG